MTLTLDRINKARQAGYDDDKIIESIEKRDPEFGSRIKRARDAGYDSAKIMESIEKRLSANTPSSRPEIPDNSQTQQQPASQPLSQSAPANTLGQAPPEQQAVVPTKKETTASVLDQAMSDQTQNNPDFSFFSPETDKAANELWTKAKDWIMQEPGPDKYAELIKPKEYTPEQLKKMSVREKMDYAQELNRYMEYMRSKGVTKGIVSGVTFGLSEKIPALRPEEGEHGQLFGEFLGSILPIEGLAKVVGWPLLKLAGMSPVYKKGLESFARITGMGVTGATYEGIKEGFKEGELPSAEQLAKHGAQWAAFESVLQGAGYLGRFLSKLRASKGNNAEKINEVISKINLEEKNPEVLKKELDSAINEVFTEEANAKINKAPEKEVKAPESKANPEAKEIEAPNESVAPKTEKQQVKEFEKKVESTENSKIQKNIDKLEARIQKAETTGNTAQVKVLQKNLAIQKKRLQEAKAVRKNSVPQNAAEVNTKEPTLVAETPENMVNPNVVQAISEKPVQTLQQGVYVPTGAQPGFQAVTNAIRGLKRGVRGGVKWVFNKGGQSVLKANPESPMYKKGWRAVEDYMSSKMGLKERFFTRWNESIGKNKKITKQDREDMIFYRERTGNPFIKGDTFEALSKRMSPESKVVVDTVVDKHMKESLALMNEAPFMQGKGVSPRQAVEEIYIRHFYSGKISPQKIDAIYESMQKRFGTDNPFKNQRTFLTFDQALKEAGLVPKYKDIVQNLAAQDGMLVRVLSNNELVSNLHDIEQELGQKLVVRSNDKKAYQKAKDDGWVPFQDPYMRSYVAGTNKAGKKNWAVTEAPALVHPDIAPSLQGVFNKDAYKPENAVLRLYDRFNSAISKFQVAASLFHFNALGESMTGSGGFITSLALSPKWWKQGSRLLENSPWVEDAVRHGLKINRPVDLELETANTFYQKLLTKMQASKNAPIRLGGKLGETANAMAGIHKFLFGSFQPRMKVVTYENYINRMLRYYEKKGMYPNEELLRQIKRESAKAVNDQFGGQVFELIPYMNNKNTNKVMHRMLSYPDWTVSAIREVANAIGSDSPIRRKLGQRYLVEYALGLAFGTQLLSYASTGLTNKEDGSVTWDPKKAHSTFENEDPKRRNFFDVQMPDLYITINGDKIPVGRDEGGRNYFMHGGKKVREIGAYFDHPVAALFSKSTPLIRDAFKYALDYTPSQEGLFPVRGAYVEGEFRPWDGTKKNTKERALSYAKEAIGGSLPFSVQTIVSDYFDSTEEWKAALARTGLKYLFSGAGAFSVGKGVSLRSSEPYWEKAHQIEDKTKRQESINALKALLKGYGYRDSQIKTIESKTRKRVEAKAEKR